MWQLGALYPRMGSLRSFSEQSHRAFREPGMEGVLYPCECSYSAEWGGQDLPRNRSGESGSQASTALPLSLQDLAPYLPSVTPGLESLSPGSCAWR